jgi:hypothetical protein
MSEVTDLSARIARLQEQIAQDQAQLSTARQEFRDRLVARLEFGISQKQQQLAEVQGQLVQAQQRDAQGTASAGQVTQANQNAKVSGAVVQNPPAEGRVFRADQVNQNLEADAGTNAPTKTTTQTQATPAPNPNSTTPTASQTGGTGARGEDGGTNNTNQTQRLVNNAFGDRIIPQPNVMDQYVSYTYAISWYLLTQDQFNAIAAGSKNTTEWKLLMQSGGAAISQRDQQFPVDFYLDNLEIQTELAMAGTGAAHSGTKIEFTVTEPAGITLIERLYRAVEAIAPENANYAVQPHCLVVRFYGYDTDGKLVTPAKGSVAGSPGVIVEKFYPMEVTNITFRNADRLVEYRVTAVPVGMYYQTGEVRGSIPYPYELVGETVEQLLVGQPNQSSAPTDGRDSQTKPEPPPAANIGAAVDANGNFTGDTTAGSLSSVVGA